MFAPAATTCCREPCASIADGHLDFTIDQQPYLQGFLPIFQLFMAKYTAGLVAPSDTNTGLLFVTRSNVRPYLTTTTRYEGSSAFSEYPVRRSSVTHAAIELIP